MTTVDTSKAMRPLLFTTNILCPKLEGRMGTEYVNWIGHEIDVLKQIRLEILISKSMS